MNATHLISALSIAVVCATIPSMVAGPNKNQLSHAALFAPNTTFPYFENREKLQTNSPGTFSADSASVLAQCSMLIYVKEADFIEEALRVAGLENTRFFDKNGSYAFLSENEENIVITFRGSESGDRADYLTNSKFNQTQFTRNGTAHSGFVEALEQVENELLEELEERLAAGPDKSVWVSGHSMGGALATLFCIRNSDSIDALYTFGSPRTVGQNLAEHWSEKLPIFRIVNNNDIVARVPSPPFYQHVGKTYFITAERELIVSPEMGEKWKELFKGHRKFMKRLITEHWMQNDFSAIPSDYFVDHSPRLYAEILLELAGKEE